MFATSRADGFSIKVSDASDCSAGQAFNGMVEAIFVMTSIASYLRLFSTYST
jgi:hypothetical protein